MGTVHNIRYLSLTTSLIGYIFTHTLKHLIILHYFTSYYKIT